jgi:hypothetical protein
MVKKTDTKQTRINLAVLDAVQSLLGKKEERKRSPQKEESVWPSSFVQNRPDLAGDRTGQGS